MRAYDVIKSKRDGGELSEAQVRWFMDAYTRGVVAPEQMSGFGGMICLDLSGGEAAAIAAYDRLRLVRRAASLGQRPQHGREVFLLGLSERRGLELPEVPKQPRDVSAAGAKDCVEVSGPGVVLAELN